MTHSWLTEIPFAHRGLHGPVSGAVENSLSAFRAANARHHGVELDVLLSRDNKPVVFHDMALGRLTGQAGNIEDFTADELSRMALGKTDDHPMTLGRILANISRKYPVLIEIKADQRRPADIAKATFEAIQGYSGPKAVMSFDPEIVRWFQQQAPDIARGLVATRDNDGTLPESYFDPVAQRRLVDSLSVDFIAYDIGGLPNEATEYCRKKAIPVLTWTIRTEQQRRKAAEYCDNIIYETLYETIYETLAK